jgi:hypothetical protein
VCKASGAGGGVTPGETPAEAGRGGDGDTEGCTAGGEGCGGRLDETWGERCDESDARCIFTSVSRVLRSLRPMTEFESLYRGSVARRCWWNATKQFAAASRDSLCVPLVGWKMASHASTVAGTTQPSEGHAAKPAATGAGSGCGCAGEELGTGSGCDCASDGGDETGSPPGAGGGRV